MTNKTASSSNGRLPIWVSLKPAQPPVMPPQTFVPVRVQADDDADAAQQDAYPSE
ncbi:MAG: hypothetical protein R3C44_18210 [Chloroflexota bacterium]